MKCSRRIDGSCALTHLGEREIDLEKEVGFVTVIFNNYQTGITSWGRQRIDKETWYQSDGKAQPEVLRVVCKNAIETLIDELERVNNKT